MIGLLTGGMLAAGLETAHADGTVTSCLGAGDSAIPYDCTLAATISDPATATVTVADTSAGSGAYVKVTVNWTVQCTDNTNGTLGTAGAPAASATPVTLDLTLPTNAADGQCNVSATVNLSPPYNKATASPPACATPTAPPTATPTPTATSTATPTPICPTEFRATLSDTSAASPSSAPPTTSAVNPVKGYGAKCLDDKGNSSANRAQVVIWTCSSSDPAENWKFSSNELIHNGKCLNDQGNGGSRSKVILWNCNGASNEKWSKLTNGELRLQSHGNTLCLDDPGYSTKNGTQLIVYSCKDTANQKWSLP